MSLINYSVSALSIATLTIVLLLLAYNPTHIFSQATPAPLAGYAWSDSIGWISFNCANTASCATSNYGLTIASDGTLSGYAWSDNIGWVSANPADITGCPSGICSPKIDPVTGVFSGWVKAISASGGWDGWVSLVGSGYGATLATTSPYSITGYGWGSDVIGWTDFQYATTSFRACTRNVNMCVGTSTVRYINNSCMSIDTICPYISYGYGCTSNACTTPPSPTSATVAISVKPTLILPKGKVVVKWDLSNVTASTCIVKGSNGDQWSGTASGSATSSAITTQTVYTIKCDGVIADPAFKASYKATVSITPTFHEV